MRVFTITPRWLARFGGKRCPVCEEGFRLDQEAVSPNYRHNRGGWWPKHLDCARKVNVDC